MLCIYFLAIPSILVCFLTGVKAVYPTKPLTVSDVGQTLHAMSQTLCHQPAHENMGVDTNVGADDVQVHVCEPTVGELLARQVRCTGVLT